MITHAVLRPGQKGTHRLVHKYGARPVCLRYRHAPRHKTVGLVIDARPLEPRRPSPADARPDPRGALHPAGRGAHRLREEEPAAADQGRPWFVVSSREGLALQRVLRSSDRFGRQNREVRVSRYRNLFLYLETSAEASNPSNQ